MATLWTYARDVLRKFLSDEPFPTAAGLAFYATLCLAPLLLIVTGVAGFVWGEESVRVQLVDQMRRLVGEEGASAMQQVMENASGPGKGVVSMMLGIATLIIGATTVFGHLQRALNRIWGVEPSDDRSKLWLLVRTRLISLTLVVSLGFLLLVSLVISAALAAARGVLDEALPDLPALWSTLHGGASLVVVALLIGILFRTLPDARVRWRDVWFGAGVTSVLFGAGKSAIGLYLGHASIGSAYGAAGSLVVLLVWLYYSSLILLLGAQCTFVRSRYAGRRLEPENHARLVRDRWPRPGCTARS